MSKFLLDANVFIEARNRYYAFEICPGFWSWMDHVVGTSSSIKKVHEELIAGKDDLAEWAKARIDHPSWFLTEDDASTQSTVKAIAKMVMESKQYLEPGKAKFLSGADPWLIAKALTLKATVVTNEAFNAEVKRTVPIPNICAAMKIPCLNTFEWLRNQAASFTFSPPLPVTLGPAATSTSSAAVHPPTTPSASSASSPPDESA